MAKTWAEISYPKEFEYAKFDGDVHFFCFRLKMPILGGFLKNLKNQNCLFKFKFGNWTNSNCYEFDGAVHFFCCRPKHPFCANLVQKIEIVTFGR